MGHPKGQTGWYAPVRAVRKVDIFPWDFDRLRFHCCVLLYSLFISLTQYLFRNENVDLKQDP